MPAEIQHQHLTANGTRFHVASSGPAGGIPVFLLHGFPEGWLSWRPLMERLGHEYRLYAMDLRGYGGSDRPAAGYDVLTLTDDVHAVMQSLGLQQPLLVGQDWGGALAWVMGHRFSADLRGIVVVNCPHPRTLLRGLLHGEDWQPLRSFYMGLFQLPRVPELALTARHGELLRKGFALAESSPGRIPRPLVEEIVASYAAPEDLTGPLNFYREALRSQLSAPSRAALEAVYAQPIAVPVTLVWGTKDLFLSAQIAQHSGQDAKRDVAWRPLVGVGHFVSMEAPDLLAREIRVQATTAPPPG